METQVDSRYLESSTPGRTQNDKYTHLRCTDVHNFSLPLFLFECRIRWALYFVYHFRISYAIISFTELISSYWTKHIRNVFHERSPSRSGIFLIFQSFHFVYLISWNCRKHGEHFTFSEGENSFVKDILKTLLGIFITVIWYFEHSSKKNSLIGW